MCSIIIYVSEAEMRRISHIFAIDFRKQVGYISYNYEVCAQLFQVDFRLVGQIYYKQMIWKAHSALACWILGFQPHFNKTQ